MLTTVLEGFVKSKNNEVSEKKILSYLRRAEVVAENSPDEQTQVGSILVSNATHSVISEGYNGFIRGTKDADLPKTRPGKYKYVVHAEENLICNAARNGVKTDDCFVVQTHSPCIKCARLLHQAGISTVYYKEYYHGTDVVDELGDMKLQFTKFDKYTKIEIKPNN